MNHRPTILAALALLSLACGKKGPPLPPYRPDPQPPTELKVGQDGDRLAVSYVSPRQTLDNQRLEVHEIEILIATRTGELAKVAQVHRVRVAPGESRTDTVALPPAETAVRVAARARNKGRRGAPTRTLVHRVQPPPAGPGSVTARLQPNGVQIAWEAPPAEPTPTPTTAPAAATPATGPAPTATPIPLSGYQVRRRAPGGTVAWLNEKPVPSTSFLDDTAKTAGRWCYTVRRAVSWEPLIASGESPEACVEVVLPH